MRKKKLFVSVILLAIILIFSGWWIMFSYLPYQSKVAISEQEIMDNIKKIAIKHTNVIAANCRVISDLSQFFILEDHEKELVENMSKDERIVLIGNSSSVDINLQPMEIYGIFESYLFLQDKRLPYKIRAISWFYTYGGPDDFSKSKLTIITKSEFGELYSSTDLTGLNNEQAAKVLGDEWIEKTGYVKR